MHCYILYINNLFENIAASLHHGLNMAPEPLLAPATLSLVMLAITYEMPEAVLWRALLKSLPHKGCISPEGVDMQPGCGHAACSMSMSMGIQHEHGHEHEAWKFTCCIYMDM